MIRRILCLRSSVLVFFVSCSALIHSACSSGSDDSSASGGSGEGRVDPGANGNGKFGDGGAAPFEGSGAYSWDGSWTPTDFPLEGIVDETHPDLPPGKWGWDNSCDCPGDEGLANHSNLTGRGVEIAGLVDEDGNRFGWRISGESDLTLDATLDYFEGSPGVDIVDLGENGQLNSTGPNDRSEGVNLGDGPDMLRYGVGWNVDLRTGDSERGGSADNDLVVLGTNNTLPTGEYDVFQTTIHTGPGSDLVFARNFGPAAIDLGNGQSGRTDSVDAEDGDDMAVLEGNMRDFRVFGGGGDDVFVWYVDEVDEDTWLGPNFFGGGSWGDAIWAEAGIDRLILVIDPTIEVVSTRGEHDATRSSFLSFIYSSYEVTSDPPTEDDVFARYYQTVPPGPGGERTVTVSYRSADSSVFTHDFYLTSVEQLQFGVGDDAVVYDVDYSNGSLSASSAPAISSVPARSSYEALFSTFPE